MAHSLAYAKEFRERGHVNLGVYMVALKGSFSQPEYELAQYTGYHLRNHYVLDEGEHHALRDHVRN